MAEDVLGAAKDGSDLAQDVAEGILGATKNGGVRVLVVKLLILPIFKARSKPLRRCTTRAKPNLRSFYHEEGNLEPQYGPWPSGPRALPGVGLASGSPRAAAYLFWRLGSAA